MKWLLFAIPVVGVGLYVLLSGDEAAAAEPKYEPPARGPGASPVGTPEGVRAQQYLLRINMALTAWKAAVPIAREAQKVLVLSTVDVVALMAAKDMAEGNITASDLQMISDAAKTAKAEIGAETVPVG